MTKNARNHSPIMAWIIVSFNRISVGEPILMGRHLIELGLAPSPQFKQILDAVYEMQLDGIINDLDIASNRSKEIDIKQWIFEN